jgi:DNA-binding CsgD family transcriptional regulator
MKTPEPIVVEHFLETTHHWNLDKLYEDLTDAKQRQGITRRKPITPTEKACLRGLLSGYTPTEIALQLNRDPVGLRVDLSRGLYRYIEMLTGSTLKDWSKVCQLLAAAGYSSQPALVNPLKDKVTQFEEPPKISGTIALSMEANEIRWVGRDPLIKFLVNKLHQGCRILNLVGITGIGKSSLSIRLALESSATQTWGQVKIIQCDRQANTFEQIARQLLGEQLVQSEEFRKNPKRLIESMIGQLQATPSLLIIDMVEELLCSKDTAIEHTGLQKSYRYTEPLFAQFFEQFLTTAEISSRLILTSQVLPPVIADGRYDTQTHTERMSGLTELEAIQLFELWDVHIKSEFDIIYLQKITHVYEGHPLALKVIAGEIRGNPYLGNIEAYWHEYGSEIEGMKEEVLIDSTPDSSTISNYSVNLTDLVEQRVEKALEQLKQSNLLAYTLLCMGSVYRCGVERAGWIFMVNNASKQEQINAWQALQRRFLLEESVNNNKVLYRLHSLIRSVALQHLNQL